MEWVWLFLQIMLINIVLSGDNAVVIALASKNLPPDKRKQAVWWGAIGAVVLRVILTVVAVTLLKVPFIQAAGSILLIYIAIKLLIDDDGHSNVKEASTLGKAVWTIIVADFVMSLDNVLAIAAVAGEDVPLIVLGIGFSIPLIIWGSTVIMNLLQKFPILVYLGAGILGYTAGEMFVKDPKMIEWFIHDYAFFHWLIPILTTVLVIGLGLMKKFRLIRVVK